MKGIVKSAAHECASHNLLARPARPLIASGNMRKLSVAVLGLLAGATLFAQSVQPPKTHLKVGDEAPDFSLPSTQGGRVKLSDFRGKNAVVLAFYPAAFTGG